MKIALIGTRGVPANYGGFETCVEEIGKRLAGRGHEVTVYCRESYYKDKITEYLGMKLVYLPNLKLKSFDTISHTFLSVLHSLGCSYDVLMVFNAANSPMLWLPRLLGCKIVINTDGLEWKRGKWGKIAKRYYKLSEWLSTKFAQRLVSDSVGIQDYYRQTYGVESTFIAYGAYVTKSSQPELLEKLELKKNEYFLQITRFEPENNPLLTIQAFKRLKTDKKLVLIGGVPYPSEYSRAMEREAGGTVILPGFIYDKALLNEIWCNCFAYVHGNAVGGTNPALLQTMASGAFTIAIDVSFSRDVLGGCGIFYEKSAEDLAEKMRWAIDNSQRLISYKERAVTRILENYSWESVTDKYEKMFRELADS